MNHTIGIIAEDESDVTSAKVLIHRIAQNDKIKVKHFLGKGCGKLRRKCGHWAKQLHIRGCSLLIIIHDRDDRNSVILEREINAAILPCPIRKFLICIPVQELEGWFLSDPDGIKLGMKLKSLPKISGLPENIKSPKEALEKIVSKASNKEIIYIHTKHNEVLAKFISLNVVKAKCPSFLPFNDFIVQNFPVK